MLNLNYLSNNSTIAQERRRNLDMPSIEDIKREGEFTIQRTNSTSNKLINTFTNKLISYGKTTPVGLALQGKFGEVASKFANDLKRATGSTKEDLENSKKFWDIVNKQKRNELITEEEKQFGKSYMESEIERTIAFVGSIGSQIGVKYGKEVAESIDNMLSKQTGLSSLPFLKQELQALNEVISNSPLNRLTKFISKKTGELPEVTGKAKTIFGTKGDDIVTELGFTDSESAREAYENFIVMKQKRDQLKQVIQELKVSDIKETSKILKEKTFIDKINKEIQAISLKIRNLEDNVLLPSELKNIKLSQLEKDKSLLNPSIKSIVPQIEIPSFNSIVSEKTSGVKQKVHIFDYFRTPEKVLEKIGLGKEAQLIRKADDAYKAHLKKDFSYLQGLRTKVPKDSSQRLFQYLDGKSVILNNEEKSVADEIKIYLKDWAEKLKLPEDNRIANYITHIFDYDLIQKEFSPELAKIIDNKVPGSVYDPFLEHRLGALGFKEDVWLALDAYVKRATRKFNFDPALEILSKSSKQLDLESLKYVKRFTANINMRPTEIDNLLDNAIKSSPIGYKLGQRPTTVLTQKFRQMIYRGTLGLNISSAIKNLTQGVNTYAKLGEKNTILGYIDLLKKGNKELVNNGVLEDLFIEDRNVSIVKKLIQKTDSILFSLFDTVEKINRGAAYYGAKRAAIDKGYTLADAINYAKQIVRDTQFAFGKIDTPVALGSDIAKTIAQLQTFNIKQTEFLINMIKNKEFGGMIRWLGGSFALVYTIGQLLNMNPQDLIPTFRLGGSPLGRIVGGLTKLLSGSEKTRAQAKSELKGVSYLGIPGGTQFKKVLKGEDIREKLFGKDYNAKTKKKGSLNLDYLSK